ncbi:MAG: radical SAM family heme chaperone HemW [Thermoanaerobaculia bacterium]
MSLGLYLHLPFCRVHCTYCPFVISTDESQQEAYVNALLQEVDRVATGFSPSSSSAGLKPVATQTAVESIYLGGGTPSRTSAANLRRIVTRIRERFDVTPGAELSMESNPEDITAESLSGWRALGVNRLSIGVQSFHDSELQPLQRVHTAARAREAIALATRTMPRVSLDLILGLPGQTQESFESTLEQAIGSGVGHISLYMLDLEERTPLQVQVERGRITIPEDELVASLYVRAIETLDRAGFHQYEISNFAREGEECRHNLRYWTGGAYLGLGVGAHSFDAERRFANTRNIRTYIGSHGDAVDFSEIIGEAEGRRERLFLRLRQTSGIHYDELQRLCGQEGIEWLDRGLRDGWLRREGERVAFTPSGFLLSTELISQLF